MEAAALVPGPPSAAPEAMFGVCVERLTAGGESGSTGFCRPCCFHLGMEYRKHTLTRPSAGQLIRQQATGGFKNGMKHCHWEIYEWRDGNVRHGTRLGR